MSIAPNHTFTVEGVYVVTLKVTDDLDFWATDNMTVTVPAPEEDGVTSVVTLLLMLVLVVITLMLFSRSAAQCSSPRRERVIQRRWPW